MKEVSELTICVVTSGLFVPMAQRLAEDAKSVMLWNPDIREFPSLKQRCIGDGMAGIETVGEFWDYLPEIDLFCFPDCQLPSLQRYLVSIDKPVWGSKGGMQFETNREKFLKTLEEVGLEVPPHQIMVGVTELSEYLQPRTDIYVKISKFRGDMETKHWRNWAMDTGWLSWLRLNFGPFAEKIRFLCFDDIDTKIELGADTFNVHGRWPSMMLNGIEGKDKCYLSAVTPTNEMPDQVQAILHAFGPLMVESSYANQMSFEVRVKDDKAYWIDATQRGGMPSTASQHKLMDNFTEVVWAGANGELLEPEYGHKFSLECMITTKPEAGEWDRVEIPEELEPWARFSACCYVDGVFGFPPDDQHSGDLGWLVAIGDTPQEVLEQAKHLADLLPDGLNADVEALSHIITEIEAMEKEGIPFTEEKLPQPAEVLD